MSIFFRNSKNSAEDMYKYIYNTYRQRVSTYISTKVHERDEVRDIVQNVFVHLWKYRDSLGKSDTENIIFKTCNQETAKYFRGKKSDLHSPLPLDIPDSSDDQIQSLLEQEEIIKNVNQNLTLLPPRTKEIFMLNKIGGVTQRQIATDLNISLKAVEKHISRARLFLQNNIKKS